MRLDGGGVAACGEWALVFVGQERFRIAPLWFQNELCIAKGFICARCVQGGFVRINDESRSACVSAGAARPVCASAGVTECLFCCAFREFLLIKGRTVLADNGAKF